MMGDARQKKEMTGLKSSFRITMLRVCYLEPLEFLCEHRAGEGAVYKDTLYEAGILQQLGFSVSFTKKT
jgi:hypothetical protein